MKRQTPSPIQYTIRSVPSEVDGVLRRKAAERKQTLNQLILNELALAADGRRIRADFSDIAGQWTPDAAFDEMIASQRRIDPEKWR